MTLRIDYSAPAFSRARGWTGVLPQYRTSSARIARQWPAPGSGARPYCRPHRAKVLAPEHAQSPPGWQSAEVTPCPRSAHHPKGVPISAERTHEVLPKALTLVALLSIFTDPPSDLFRADLRQFCTQDIHFAHGIFTPVPGDPGAQGLVNDSAALAGRNPRTTMAIEDSTTTPPPIPEQSIPPCSPSPPLTFEPRTATVTYTELGAPYLRLRGRWLEQAGFPIGTTVRIEVLERRLILEVVPPTEPPHCAEPNCPHEAKNKRRRREWVMRVT